MCGIAGIAGARDESLLQRMTETLAHRGPDDAGSHFDDQISLGHRRLSIIDLECGRQPMSSAGGAHWLVYNGEIYNFRELRETLERRGYRFSTHSDTEVILHAYAEYGDACVDCLQGMFAFALWDGPRSRLLLARDPLGVKPLYYAQTGGRLYFASEIKALLQAPEISRTLDLQALDEYLTFLYTVPPRTIFQEVRQLPPGHRAVWERSELQVRRYWRPRLDPEPLNEAAWVERTRALLQETVEKYLVSDVPVGAFLSGGIDSASIVSCMAKATREPIHTFTIGFRGDGTRYDESAEAAAIARTLGTQHRLLTVEADVSALLPQVVRHFDEPFGNPTALLSYAISGLVRQHVKVVLSGDGGDESFGGYPRYAGARLAETYRRLPAWLLGRFINPLVQQLPESTSGAHTLRRLREFSAGTLLPPVEMYAQWISYYSREQRQELYTAGLRAELEHGDPLDFIRRLADEADTQDPVSQALYIDLHSFLPHNVLQYGDRMSMAHGLETRVPLADPRLVETLLRAPSQLKVNGLRTKELLRKAMVDRLPKEVLSRRKRGFNPPMGIWLNTSLRTLVNEYLGEETLRRRGYFEPASVQRLLREHRSGRRDNTWHLWALLVFEEWHRQYLDG